MSVAASSNYYGSSNAGDYSSASGSNFIPEVWSGKLQVKFYKSTVLGEITNKGEVFRGQHQAIITRAQWEAVEAIIAQRNVATSENK